MSEINVTNLTDAAGVSNALINQAANKPCDFCVSGFTIDFTIMILGLIFFAIVGVYLLLMIFGYPIFISNSAASKGSIIQHTNTPKSAVFKIAKVSGGGFRYSNIKDGTVATATNSVYNIRGRNLVLTFAQLGITIPINILAGISVLVHNDIKNIIEFKQKYEFNTTKDVLNEDDTISKVPIKAIKRELILAGYNFDNFIELKKQIGEEKLIPLTIEAFSDFNEKNIASDTSERYVKTKELIISENEPIPGTWDIMKWLFAIIALLIFGFAIVK